MKYVDYNQIFKVQSRTRYFTDTDIKPAKPGLGKGAT